MSFLYCYIYIAILLYLYCYIVIFLFLLTQGGGEDQKKKGCQWLFTSHDVCDITSVVSTNNLHTEC